jgi:hypothetical protein
MDDLDSCLLAGFCTYFPDYSKLQEHTATHQRKVLQAMLQATLCAETEFNNIRTIASEVYGGGGQAFPAQVNTSQCEKTMTCYGSGDEGTNKSNCTSGRLFLCCCGCGSPHPWLVLENGIYVIKCPQASDARIAKNARRTIKTHRPVLPVAIQSVMPRITLQLGTNLDCSNCPSI